jgi:hypothetical protein
MSNPTCRIRHVQRHLTVIVTRGETRSYYYHSSRRTWEWFKTGLGRRGKKKRHPKRAEHCWANHIISHLLITSCLYSTTTKERDDKTKETATGRREREFLSNNTQHITYIPSLFIYRPIPHKDIVYRDIDSDSFSLELSLYRSTSAFLFHYCGTRKR